MEEQSNSPNRPFPIPNSIHFHCLSTFFLVLAALLFPTYLPSDTLMFSHLCPYYSYDTLSHESDWEVGKQSSLSNLPKDVIANQIDSSNRLYQLGHSWSGNFHFLIHSSGSFPWFYTYWKHTERYRKNKLFCYLILLWTNYHRFGELNNKYLAVFACLFVSNSGRWEVYENDAD